MSEGKEAPDHNVGYRNPPASTRFRKGQSGNPKGRPRGRRNELPYEAVLGQMVTVRENGVERLITAAEAFLLHVTKLGLEGDGPAARAAMAAIEEARAARGADGREPLRIIIRRMVAPGSVSSALTALRMAQKLDRYRPTARIALEPWLVEKALERLGDRRLSREEQATVVKANALADPNGDIFRTDEISVRLKPAAWARDRISSGSDKENGGIDAGFVPDCSAKAVDIAR